MILVKRLTGSALAINPDLIERVESNPDTVVTLVDGKKILIQETVEQLVGIVLDYRAEVLRQAYAASGELPTGGKPPLRLVVDREGVARTSEPSSPSAPPPPSHRPATFNRDDVRGGGER